MSESPLLVMFPTADSRGGQFSDNSEPSYLASRSRFPLNLTRWSGNAFFSILVTTSFPGLSTSRPASIISCFFALPRYRSLMCVVYHRSGNSSRNDHKTERKSNRYYRSKDDRYFLQAASMIEAFVKGTKKQ